MKKNTKNSLKIKKLVYSGVFLALALLLPFLTGQIPEVGSALSPMHIPVLLCGFVCGWPWGLAVGLIAPLLRFTLFGMPPVYPTAVAMSFELAMYGFAAGIMYKHFPKKIPYIYLTLILAMIAGRLVWGAATYVLIGLQGSSFNIAAFWAGAVVNAIPGIICHIVLIPLIVIALKKARLMLNE